MEILCKVGTRFVDPEHPGHTNSWRDGQVIEMMPSGTYIQPTTLKHHCVIDLPQIDFWTARGSTNWKSDASAVRNFKKFLRSANDKDKYEWDHKNGLFVPKRKTRDRFIDFKELLNLGYITSGQYDDIYDKDTQIKLSLGAILDFTSIIKHEDSDQRLDPSKLLVPGSVASGTYTIGSGGGDDYATVTAAEADTAAQLTGNLTFEHQNEETVISTAVTFDVDSNSYTLKYTPVSGAEHNGGAYGNGARINFGTWDSLVLDETNEGDLDDFEFSKLAIDCTGAGNKGFNIVDGGNSGTLLFNRLLIVGDSDSLLGISVANGYNWNNLVIRNNTVYGVGNGAGEAGIEINTAAGNGTISILNNTCCKNYNNFFQDAASEAGSPTVTVKNNIAQGDTGGSDFADDGAGWGTSGTNLSEDATSPNASYQSKNCHDGNSCFTDYTNNVFTLDSGGDEITDLDDGEDLSGTFTDDIVGTTRSTWYMGSYEIAAAAGRTTRNTRSNPLGVRIGQQGRMA